MQVAQTGREVQETAAHLSLQELWAHWLTQPASGSCRLLPDVKKKLKKNVKKEGKMKTYMNIQ